MDMDILNALNVEPPELEQVIPGLVAGTVGVLSAPGSTGKSMFALQAAMTIAGAKDMLNFRNYLTGRVRYYSLEDPQIITHGRLFRLGKHLHLSDEERFEVASKLFIRPLVGKPFDIMWQNPTDAFDSTAGDIARECMGFRLIIVDTFNRSHSMEENSNGEMSQVMRRFEYIANETGAAVLLLHHTGKAAARTGDGGQQSTRGASAIVDNARWGATLRGMTEDESGKYSRRKDGQSIADEELGDRSNYVRFECTKVNYAAIPDAKWLERNGGILSPPDALREVFNAGKKDAEGKKRDAL